ncbi:hypothetical protein Pla22_25660 [Rubripirellula amarantea]|uniref:Uncharacterized protein n=1 Tax=Rubripirellula amarantea TaxID=2527999 RepID=A0A5C5WYD3_9BACT|nr:hypothetical protein [Rubripirellula amarantea]TWT54912.1 hypothetical protein Pla22_25660 [Rubripirellula amarantea]
MTNFRRNHLECVFRKEASSHIGCSLIEEVLGDSGHEFSVVEPQVCECCCRQSEPQVTRWNPTIASLILERSSKMLADSDVPPNQKAKLESVRSAALDRIPITLATDTFAVSPPLASGPVDSLTLSDLQQRIPLPPLQHELASPEKSSSFCWAVGITTASREEETLGDTLAALGESGWSHASLFVDGPMSVDTTLAKLRDVLATSGRLMNVDVTQRSTAVGGWSNFCLMIAELYHRYPTADAFLLLQDDALLARYSDLRHYLEVVMQRIGSRSIASLFCSGVEAKQNTGWHRRDNEIQYGAQAFVFGKEAMHQWLASFADTQPKGENPQVGIDGRIGRWAWRKRIPIWLPHPSLVWHLGETSTLWGDAQPLGPRQASDFLETMDQPS